MGRNAAFGIIIVTSLSNRGENQRQLHRKSVAIATSCKATEVATTESNHHYQPGHNSHNTGSITIRPSLYPSSINVTTSHYHHYPPPPHPQQVKNICTANNIATTTITVTPLSSINISTISNITYYHHITTTPPSPTNDTTNNTTTTTTYHYSPSLTHQHPGVPCYSPPLFPTIAKP